MKSASLQYANALADIALGSGAAEPTRKELREFGAAYSGSAELRNSLVSPSVPRKAKHAVIEKITARLGAGRIIRNFLFLIVDNHRTHSIPEIIETFEQVLQQRQGFTEAEVRSATELSAAQKAALEESLGKLTGRKVQTRYSLDAGLLGGVVVRVGDTVYDGSVRSRLNALGALLAG